MKTNVSFLLKVTCFDEKKPYIIPAEQEYGMKYSLFPKIYWKTKDNFIS